MSEIINYTKHLDKLVAMHQFFHVLSIVFYAYGIKKWIDFQDHLMIQQRFPLISKVIVLISFIGCTLTTIRRWIQFKNNDVYYSPDSGSFAHTLWLIFIESSGESLSFLVYGLTNLRLFLIYLKWKQAQNQIQIHLGNLTFQQMAPIHINKSFSPMNVSSSYQDRIKIDIPALTTNKTFNTNIFHHWFCITIFTFTIIGFLYMTIFRVGTVNTLAVALNESLWTLMLLVNIILVFFIICKTVKEGIGCLKETIIMLLYSFVVAIFASSVYGIKNETVLFIFLAILSSVSFFQGTFPLYFALYYVYKVEGTLDKNMWRQNHEARIRAHSTNTSGSNVESVTQSSVKFYENINFVDFLKEYKNYKAFSLYLSYCWA
eukprot:345694_1